MSAPQLSRFVHQGHGLALATGLLLTAVSLPVQAARTIIRFDEAEFPLGTPVNGLRIETLAGNAIAPLSFSFTLEGDPSDSATVANGPGDTTWVAEPGIEGPTSGELSIEFDEPVTSISFGIALARRMGEEHAIELQAEGEDGVEYTQEFNTIEVDNGFAGAYVEWTPPSPLRELNLEFSSDAPRFLLDNLALSRDGSGGPPPQVEPVVGEATWARLIERQGALPPLLLWKRKASSNRVEIWSAPFDPMSGQLDDPTLLTRTTESATVPLQVAATQAAGQVWVAWTSPALAETRAAIFDGVAFSPTFSLRSSPSQGLQLLSQRDGMRALWRAGGSIWTRGYSADGTPVEASRPLPIESGEIGLELRSRTLGDFGFVLAYPTIDGSEFRVHWFTRGAQKRGETFRYPLAAGRKIAQLELATAPLQGGTIAAWIEESGSQRSVHGRRFYASSAPRGAQLAVVLDQQPGTLAVAANSDGDFGVVWDASNVGSAVGNESSLQARFFNSSADPAQENPLELAVLPTSLNPGDLALNLSLDNTDTATIIYTSSAELGPSGIYAANQRLRLQGSPDCIPGPRQHCLADGRFRVTAEFFDSAGIAHPAMAIPWTEDSGMFWFFGADNVELVCKVLDGRQLNGAFWVFYAALSNQQFSIYIEDTLTGEHRSWTNPAGRFASVGDISALPSYEGASAPRGQPQRTGAGELRREPEFGGAPEETKTPPTALWWQAISTPDPATGLASDSGATGEDPRLLRLAEGRFEVRVRFETDSLAGDGIARSISRDTGAFWFFDPDNVELVVKVLDGSSINGHHWVFYGSLSNVSFELEVLDLETGESARYINESSEFASRGDIEALPARGSSDL